MKPANPGDPQFYEGIKVRAQPLKLNVPPPLSPPQSAFNPSPAPPPKAVVPRRKSKLVVVKTGAASPLAVEAEPETASNASSPSPASPILKAQLSAPPKPRETLVAPGDSKCQVNGSLCKAIYLFFW